VAFDLTYLSLDMRGREYGLAARGACVLAGTDALFLAGRRGVVSVRQTEQGKIQSLDLPLSWDIEKLIDRIAWPVARQTARLAYWNNKLYAAVPIDDARIEMVTRVAAPATFDSLGLAFYSGLVPGQAYQWTRGANASQIESGGEVLTQEDGTFVPEFTTALVTGLPSGQFTGSLTSTSALERVNNTVLVYDFVQSKWAGRDTGMAQGVLEYFLFPYGGVDRLFYLDASGYVNLVEESDNGCDQVAGGGQDGLAWEPIAYRWRSRRYSLQMDRLRKPIGTNLALATWNPKYSVDVIFQGVNKVTPAAIDVTKDRTKYYRPWDAAAYDAANTNDDHATEDREDYSVDISGGVLLGSNGVALMQYQESLEGLPVNGRHGRRFQVEVRNTQGRIKVLGVELDSVESRQRKGSLV